MAEDTRATATIVDYDPLDQVFSIGGEGFYLLVHEIPPETLRTLLKVESAVWEDRSSIRAGATLGHPVFWSTDRFDLSLVSVIVGPDDGPWQVSVQVPTKTLLRAVAAAEPSRDI